MRRPHLSLLRREAGEKLDALEGDRPGPRAPSQHGRDDRRDELRDERADQPAESCSGAAWHTQKAPRPAKPKTSVSGRPKANASAQSKGAASTSCAEMSVPTSPRRRGRRRACARPPGSGAWVVLDLDASHDREPRDTSRRLLPAAARVVHEAPERGTPWLTTSQSSGTRISIPPQNAKVSITAARPSGIARAAGRSRSRPSPPWPGRPRKSWRGDDRLRAAHEQCVEVDGVARRRPSAGGTGTRAIRGDVAPRPAAAGAARRRRTEAAEVDGRSATPTPIQMRADTSAPLDDILLTAPIATRIERPEAQDLWKSTNPRLSSASTGPPASRRGPAPARGVI